MTGLLDESGIGAAQLEAEQLAGIYNVVKTMAELISEFAQRDVQMDDLIIYSGKTQLTPDMDPKEAQRLEGDLKDIFMNPENKKALNIYLEDAQGNRELIFQMKDGKVNPDLYDLRRSMMEFYVKADADRFAQNANPYLQEIVMKATMGSDSNDTPGLNPVALPPGIEPKDGLDAANSPTVLESEDGTSLEDLPQPQLDLGQTPEPDQTEGQPFHDEAWDNLPDAVTQLETTTQASNLADRLDPLDTVEILPTIAPPVRNQDQTEEWVMAAIAPTLVELQEATDRPEQASKLDEIIGLEDVHSIDDPILNTAYGSALSAQSEIESLKSQMRSPGNDNLSPQLTALENQYASFVGAVDQRVAVLEQQENRMESVFISPLESVNSAEKMVADYPTDLALPPDILSAEEFLADVQSHGVQQIDELRAEINGSLSGSQNLAETLGSASAPELNTWSEQIKEQVQVATPTLRDKLETLGQTLVTVIQARATVDIAIVKSTISEQLNRGGEFLSQHAQQALDGVQRWVIGSTGVDNAIDRVLAHEGESSVQGERYTLSKIGDTRSISRNSDGATVYSGGKLTATATASDIDYTVTLHRTVDQELNNNAVQAAPTQSAPSISRR